MASISGHSRFWIELGMKIDVSIGPHWTCLTKFFLYEYEFSHFLIEKFLLDMSNGGSWTRPFPSLDRINTFRSKLHPMLEIATV